MLIFVSLLEEILTDAAQSYFTLARQDSEYWSGPYEERTWRRASRPRLEGGWWWLGLGWCYRCAGIAAAAGAHTNSGGGLFTPVLELRV